MCSVSGGLDLKTQEAALRTGPDVVVATPGRLIDHLHNSPSFSLSAIEVGLMTLKGFSPGPKHGV